MFLQEFDGKKYNYFLVRICGIENQPLIFLFVDYSIDFTWKAVKKISLWLLGPTKSLKTSRSAIQLLRLQS